MSHGLGELSLPRNTRGYGGVQGGKVRCGPFRWPTKRQTDLSMGIA